MIPEDKNRVQKAVREMTTEELRELVAQIRQRAQQLNEEMRTLQEELESNAQRLQQQRDRRRPLLRETPYSHWH